MELLGATHTQKEPVQESDQQEESRGGYKEEIHPRALKPTISLEFLTMRDNKLYFLFKTKGENVEYKM